MEKDRHQNTISVFPSRATSSAGWVMVAALVMAPWAFGCRPYFWSGILTAMLWMAALLWMLGLTLDKRRPQTSAWYLGGLGLIGAMAWIALWNPRSVYDPTQNALLPVQSFITCMPSTVDAANSWPPTLLLTGLLMAMIVTADLSLSPRWRQHFATTMALTGVSVVIGGLLLKAAIFPSLFAYLSRRPWSNGDIFGPFDYHGNAGTFLILTLPAMAAQAGLAARPSNRIWWLGVLGLGYLGTLVNSSRAALVLAIIALPAIVWVVLTAWHRKSSARARAGLRPAFVWIILATMTVAVSILLIRGGSKAVQRFATLRTEVSVPWYPRFLQSRAAWEMVEEHPTFGTGIGSYRLLVQNSSIRGKFFAPSYRPGEPFTVLSNTNNDYLQTLVEWGWIGFALWALFIGAAMLSLLSFLRKIGGRNPIGCATAIALASVYVHATVDCPFQIPVLQLYTAVYLALAASSVRWREIEPIQARNRWNGGF